ncbi:MAG TPA: MarR family transcriptional regulator [Acidimicrobiia bacterium]
MVLQDDEPVGRMLALTHKLIHARFDANLAEQGSSFATWIVLRYAIEGGFSQRQLADEMRIEAPTLVRRLDRMERDGLVERRRDPNDRRVVRIHVTRAGKQLHDKLLRVVIASNEELRSLLSADEERVLQGLLHRVYDHYTTDEGIASAAEQR